MYNIYIFVVTGKLSLAASVAYMKPVLLKVAAFFLFALLIGLSACKRDKPADPQPEPIVPPVVVPIIPAISGFLPAKGLPGSTITITGKNFNIDKNKNTVTIGGETAYINSVTATTIVVDVPAKVKTGRVVVVTDGLTLTSATDFTPLTATQTTFSTMVFDEMAADPAGNIYGVVHDQKIKKQVIYKIPPSGGAAVVFGGTDDPVKNIFQDISGMAADASGNIYVSDDYKGCIYKVTEKGGTSLYADGKNDPGLPVGSSYISHPAGLVWAPSGNLYFIEGHDIRKVDSRGTVSLFVTDKNPFVFDYYSAITIDPAGKNIYVADSYPRHVVRITEAGVATTLSGTVYPGDAAGVVGYGHFAVCFSLAVDNGGNIFIADYNDFSEFAVLPLYMLQFMNTASNVTTLLKGNFSTPVINGDLSQATVNNIHNVLFDASGNLYINNTNNYGSPVISKITFK